MANIANAIGLYTEKQMDEKRERIDELWKMLSKVHSFMETQAVYLRAMTHEDHKFPNGEIESPEMRMVEIRMIADRMADLAGKAEVVLTDYRKADWS